MVDALPHTVYCRMCWELSELHALVAEYRLTGAEREAVTHGAAALRLAVLAFLRSRPGLQPLQY
eukprot:904420-Lingulodinium_polyedra.AAC.1